MKEDAIKTYAPHPYAHHPLMGLMLSTVASDSYSPDFVLILAVTECWGYGEQHGFNLMVLRGSGHTDTYFHLREDEAESLVLRGSCQGWCVVR